MPLIKQSWPGKPTASAESPGSGKVVGELLKDGPTIKLVQPFGYIDAKGQHWDVPAGAKTGAP
jgi:hypothetical protein